MSRGTTLKYDTPATLTLLRPMITRRYELVADHEACCGCQVCQAICPQGAIHLGDAEVTDGRLVNKPRLDIDETRCNFCGECVVLCPTRALAMTVNGQREVPVLRADAFPTLERTARVNQEALAASADVRYIEDCPVGAISADVTRDAAGAVTGVANVRVDEERCVSCTRCMEEGPAGGFAISKPWRGRTSLDVTPCPAGCQACADACPTHAITYDGTRVHLDERFCLYCGVCQDVCPAEGALRIARTGVRHMPIESGAWRLALEKLVSLQEVVREFDVKGQQKRRSAVLKRLLPELAPDGDGRA